MSSHDMDGAGSLAAAVTQVNPTTHKGHTVNKLSKREFLDQAEELVNESQPYLEAVYEWTECYALPMDDAEYILDAAAEKYAGEHDTASKFAENYYEDVHAERLEAIRSLAMEEPMIHVDIDWEKTAHLIMPNTLGMDYFTANGHYFWAAN